MQLSISPNCWMQWFCSPGSAQRRNPGLSSVNRANGSVQVDMRNTVFTTHCVLTKSKPSIFTHVVCICFFISVSQTSNQIERPGSEVRERETTNNWNLGKNCHCYLESWITQNCFHLIMKSISFFWQCCKSLCCLLHFK